MSRRVHEFLFGTGVTQTGPIPVEPRLVPHNDGNEGAADGLNSAIASSQSAQFQQNLSVPAQAIDTFEIDEEDVETDLDDHSHLVLPTAALQAQGIIASIIDQGLSFSCKTAINAIRNTACWSIIMRNLYAEVLLQGLYADVQLANSIMSIRGTTGQKVESALWSAYGLLSTLSPLNLMSMLIMRPLASDRIANYLDSFVAAATKQLDEDQINSLRDINIPLRSWAMSIRKRLQHVLLTRGQPFGCGSASSDTSIEPVHFRWGHNLENHYIQKTDPAMDKRDLSHTDAEAEKPILSRINERYADQQKMRQSNAPAAVRKEHTTGNQVMDEVVDITRLTKMLQFSSCGVPQENQHHAVSANHRASAMAVIQEIIDTMKPKVFILHQAEIIRESFRFPPDCVVFAVCSIMSRDDQKRSAQWVAGISRLNPNQYRFVTDADGQPTPITRLHLDNDYRAAVAAACAQERPVILGQVHVSYYTQCHEIPAVPLGGFIIDVCQSVCNTDLSEHIGEGPSDDAMTHESIITHRKMAVGTNDLYVGYNNGLGQYESFCEEVLICDHHSGPCIDNPNEHHTERVAVTTYSANLQTSNKCGNIVLFLRTSPATTKTKLWDKPATVRFNDKVYPLRNGPIDVVGDNCPRSSAATIQYFNNKGGYSVNMIEARAVNTIPNISGRTQSYTTQNCGIASSRVPHLSVIQKTHGTIQGPRVFVESHGYVNKSMIGDRVANSDGIFYSRSGDSARIGLMHQCFTDRSVRNQLGWLDDNSLPGLFASSDIMFREWNVMDLVRPSSLIDALSTLMPCKIREIGAKFGWHRINCIMDALACLYWPPATLPVVTSYIISYLMFDDVHSVLGIPRCPSGNADPFVFYEVVGGKTFPVGPENTNGERQTNPHRVAVDYATQHLGASTRTGSAVCEPTVQSAEMLLAAEMIIRANTSTTQLLAQMHQEIPSSKGHSEGPFSQMQTRKYKPVFMADSCAREIDPDITPVVTNSHSLIEETKDSSRSISDAMSDQRPTIFQVVSHSAFTDEMTAFYNHRKEYDIKIGSQTASNGFTDCGLKVVNFQMIDHDGRFLELLQDVDLAGEELNRATSIKNISAAYNVTSSRAYTLSHFISNGKVSGGHPEMVGSAAYHSPMMQHCCFGQLISFGFRPQDHHVATNSLTLAVRWCQIQHALLRKAGIEGHIACAIDFEVDPKTHLVTSMQISGPQGALIFYGSAVRYTYHEVLGEASQWCDTLIAWDKTLEEAIVNGFLPIIDAQTKRWAINGGVLGLSPESLANALCGTPFVQYKVKTINYSDYTPNLALSNKLLAYALVDVLGTLYVHCNSFYAQHINLLSGVTIVKYGHNYFQVYSPIVKKLLQEALTKDRDSAIDQIATRGVAVVAEGTTMNLLTCANGKEYPIRHKLYTLLVHLQGRVPQYIRKITSHDGQEPSLDIFNLGSGDRGDQCPWVAISAGIIAMKHNMRKTCAPPSDPLGWLVKHSNILSTGVRPGQGGADATQMFMISSAGLFVNEGVLGKNRVRIVIDVLSNHNNPGKPYLCKNIETSKKNFYDLCVTNFKGSMVDTVVIPVYYGPAESAKDSWHAFAVLPTCTHIDYDLVDGPHRGHGVMDNIYDFFRYSTPDTQVYPLDCCDGCHDMAKDHWTELENTITDQNSVWDIAYSRPKSATSCRSCNFKLTRMVRLDPSFISTLRWLRSKDTLNSALTHLRNIHSKVLHNHILAELEKGSRKQSTSAEHEQTISQNDVQTPRLIQHFDEFSSGKGPIQPSAMMPPIKLGHVTINPDTTYKIAEGLAQSSTQKTAEVIHVMKQQEPRTESRLAYDPQTRRYGLTSVCMPFNDPSVRDDIIVDASRSTYDPSECHELSGSVTVLLPIALHKGSVLPCTQCKCARNSLSALARANNAQQPNDPVLTNNFLQFVQVFLETHYPAGKLVSQSKHIDLIEVAEEYLANQDKPVSVKARILDEFARVVLGDHRKLRLSVTSHIKTEVVSDTRARIIQAVDDAARFVQQGVYSVIHERIYASDHMIKHKTPAELQDRLQGMANKYDHVGTNDMSAYDSSQRFAISQVERITIKHLTGEKWAELWDAIGVSSMTQYFSGILVHTPYQMPSGKITTSSTNTFLNQMLITWAMTVQKKKVGVDYDFLVEGDDNIIFFNDSIAYNNAMDLIRGLGFHNVGEIVDINEADFVGWKMYRDSDQNINLYQDVGRIIRKLPFCNRRTNHKHTIKDIVYGKVMKLAQLPCVELFYPLIEAISQKYGVWDVIQNKIVCNESGMKWSHDFQEFFRRRYAAGIEQYTRDMIDLQLEPQVFIPRCDSYSFAAYPAQNKEMSAVYYNRDRYRIGEVQAGHDSGRTEPHLTPKIQNTDLMSQPDYPQDEKMNAYFDRLATYLAGDSANDTRQNLTAPFEDVVINYKDQNGNPKTVTTKAMPLNASNYSSFKNKPMLLGDMARRYIPIAIDSDLIKILKQRWQKNGRQLIGWATAHNQKLGLNFSVMNNRWEHFTAAAKSENFRLPIKSGYLALLTRSVTLEPSTAEVAKLTIGRYTQPEEDFLKALALRGGPVALPGVVQANQKIQGLDYMAQGQRGQPRNRKPNDYASGREKNDPQQRWRDSAVYYDSDGDFNLDESVTGDFVDDDVRSSYTAASQARYAARGERDIQSSLFNALSSLPQIMDAVAETITGHPDREWAMSVMSPFDQASQGARIPAYVSTPTVTATFYQDYDFKITGEVGLLINSFTAFNTETYVLLQNITQATLDEAPVDITAYYASGYPGIAVNTIEYQTRVITLPFVNNAQFLSGTQFGGIPNVTGLFNQARVSSAGIRFYKTSASTNESGMIKAFYASYGARIAKNLNQQLGYYHDDKNHVRVYVASGSGVNMGQTGFMLGAIFQPLDVDESTQFNEAEQLYLMDGSKLDYQQLAIKHKGPTRILFKTNSAPFTAGDWYVLDNVAYAGIVAGTIVVNTVGLDVNSLQQKHLVMTCFESVQADTTFEFQNVIHYEGIPSSESQYLECRAVTLDPKYSTPMDILRRFDFSDFRVGPGLNITDPNKEMIMAQGLFNSGFFHKVGNALQKGIDSLKRHPEIKDKLLSLTPQIARAISALIPEAAPIIIPLVQHLTDVVDKKLTPAAMRDIAFRARPQKEYAMMHDKHQGGNRAIDHHEESKDNLIERRVANYGFRSLD